MGQSGCRFKDAESFGGEAVSLALNYTHSEQFAAAGYEPFTVDGTEYGEVRQYGNCTLPSINQESDSQ